MTLLPYGVSSVEPEQNAHQRDRRKKRIGKFVLVFSIKRLIPGGRRQAFVNPEHNQRPG